METLKPIAYEGRQTKLFRHAAKVAAMSKWAGNTQGLRPEAYRPGPGPKSQPGATDIKLIYLL